MTLITEVNQQYVNKVAKYVYSRLSGKTKLEFRRNEAVIHMYMYYHTGQKSDPISEMHFTINFVCYAGKIRVNVIDMSEYEYTVCHMTVDATGKTLEDIRTEIMSKINKAIQKEYSAYDLIY